MFRCTSRYYLGGFTQNFPASTSKMSLADGELVSYIDLESSLFVSWNSSSSLFILGVTCGRLFINS